MCVVMQKGQLQGAVSVTASTIDGTAKGMASVPVSRAQGKAYIDISITTETDPGGRKHMENYLSMKLAPNETMSEHDTSVFYEYNNYHLLICPPPPKMVSLCHPSEVTFAM